MNVEIHFIFPPPPPPRNKRRQLKVTGLCESWQTFPKCYLRAAAAAAKTFKMFKMEEFKMWAETSDVTVASYVKFKILNVFGL